jgi:hypothetical protein
VTIVSRNVPVNADGQLVVGEDSRMPDTWLGPDLTDLTPGASKTVTTEVGKTYMVYTQWRYAPSVAIDGVPWPGWGTALFVGGLVFTATGTSHTITVSGIVESGIAYPFTPGVPADSIIRVREYTGETRRPVTAMIGSSEVRQFSTASELGMTAEDPPFDVSAYDSWNTENLGIGQGALSAVTPHAGWGNHAFGAATLGELRSGEANIAIGNFAFMLLQRGEYNIGIGEGVCSDGLIGDLADSQMAYDNIFIGDWSACYLEDGARNVNVGDGGLARLVEGDYNTTLGSYAGSYLVQGSNNLFLGREAGSHATAQVGTVSGSVAIGTDSAGTGAYTTANNEFVLGTALHTLKVPGLAVELTTAGKGIVLKSPDGTRYLITVANGGTLAVSSA